MKVIVAEKPSVAREIAAVVGASGRREGYFEGSGYQVTWALGHLVSLMDPDDYDPSLKRWTMDTLPIIPSSFRLKQTGDGGARKQFQVIKALLPGASELICATDAGREGELIFRYILEHAQGKRKRPVCENITRLWLSSLTEAAIRAGLKGRRPISDYDALYAAARCRSESDWIVGMNATRCYTVRFGQRGTLWSVGRVQTPVLALLARRDDEIKHFVSVPWFELQTKYRNVLFKRRAGRFGERADAEALLESLTDKPFVLRKITPKREKVLPPQLYDLTALQRDMNVRYGMSAADTLKHAQALYEAKAITYPRTDSRYLSVDMQGEVRESLERLRSVRGKEIGALELNQLSKSRRIFDDARVSDHHAILATGNRAGAVQGSPQARVYDAIVTRMIAAFYPPCLKDITTVEGQVETTTFTARGVQVVEPGWTSLYPARKKGRSKDDAGGPQADHEDQELPPFVPGESGPHAPFVKEGQTKPPHHHTENSLLGMMETAGKLVEDDSLKEALKERGLGTPATRAAIIETLLRRNYIVRQGKALHITDLGVYLIALIQDPILKSAEMTGDWEAKLKEIERGKLGAEDFMDQVKSFTRQLIENSEERRGPADGMGPCPRCGAGIVEGKRGYGCEKWKEGCSYVLWKDYRGHQIGREQAAELFRRHISLSSVESIEGADGCVLYLSEAGHVCHVALPHGNTSAKKGGKASAPGKREARKPASGVSGGAGFDCPSCQSEVIERPKSYSCAGWKSGCGFVIWKSIAGKKISRAMATKLAKVGETGVLKGFKSKAGKRFDARLKLQNNKVQFVLE